MRKIKRALFEFVYMSSCILACQVILIDLELATNKSIGGKYLTAAVLGSFWAVSQWYKLETGRKKSNDDPIQERH